MQEIKDFIVMGAVNKKWGNIVVEEKPLNKEVLHTLFMNDQELELYNLQKLALDD